MNTSSPYGPGWDARRIEKLVYQTVRCNSAVHMCQGSNVEDDNTGLGHELSALSVFSSAFALTLMH